MSLAGVQQLRSVPAPLATSASAAEGVRDGGAHATSSTRADYERSKLLGAAIPPLDLSWSAGLGLTQGRGFDVGQPLHDRTEG